MRTVAIIQARLGSTRLPGKVLVDILGMPVLWHVVQRAKQAQYVDEVVIATTTQEVDQAIVSLCQDQNWAFFQGSEEDVLDRYYQAARQYHAQVIVRITSDCPLLAPEVVDQVINTFLAGQPGLDYVSNSLPERTFPRGLDTEVFSFATLQRAWREDGNPAWREHVTPYIYRRPEQFKLGFVRSSIDYSKMRWTLDTPEDLAFIRKVYEHFGHANFSWRDVLNVLDEHPEWSEINSNVKQKVVP